MMPPLKYGHRIVARLSANMGSHAVKVHVVAENASQLTLCATVMFNVPVWLIPFQVSHSQLLSQYNAVRGVSVAIKMIIKWQRGHAGQIQSYWWLSQVPNAVLRQHLGFVAVTMLSYMKGCYKNLILIEKSWSNSKFSIGYSANKAVVVSVGLL